jgi:hypothetical protein
VTYLGVYNQPEFEGMRLKTWRIHPTDRFNHKGDRIDTGGSYLVHAGVLEVTDNGTLVFSVLGETSFVCPAGDYSQCEMVKKM